MLPRAQRLRRADHNYLQIHKEVVHTPYFSLHFTLAPTGELRAAAVVSKKIAAKAVARNQLRRLLYREMRPWLQNLPALWLAIYPKKTVYGLSKQQVSAEMKRLFELLYAKV